MLDLAKCRFSQGAFVLDVDWSLGPTDRLAVIGPSGAGKSTLLNAIAGFAVQTQGDIFWHQSPLATDVAARPVAMLFQEHNLFPHLSVSQNVGLGIRAATRFTKEQLVKIDLALEKVGLENLGRRLPSELSGGQQSRVALARILVMARPIILLDEPFSALGPAQRLEMLQLVRSVADDLGAILIMVTHDPGEARALAGLVCFVEDGIAQTPIEAEAFFKNPPEGMRRYTGAF